MARHVMRTGLLSDVLKSDLLRGILPRRPLIAALAGSILVLPFAAPVQGALAASADPLAGQWLAEDIGGGGVVDRIQTTLAFGGDGKVTGSGGCNHFTGKAEITGETLRIGPLASTRMACPPAVMGQEQKFFNALQGVKSWAIDGNGKLLLRDAGGKQLALLTRVRQGAAITIEVPTANQVETIKASYACGDRVVDATYFNAGEISLVSLSIKGEFVVAANVLAGSGAKYAGGRFIWWTKGNMADLYDLTKGENAQPVACKQT
ncbi:Membrane-bound inhibitor of C-type lysozyme [Hyphomicrobiales bacterium]|nr:Membrane-bound inhibitor of C-type lysozyme [Hyphomicrobiales bacterium]CAH1663704.1 Membrane-bound inhibitor of C-type lysozyme [Hyphomicrobiales bacterium]